MSPRETPVWTREALQARVDRAPFNAWLGLEVLDGGNGSITLRLRTRPEILGHAAIHALHGGVLAAVLDTACSMAVVSATGESVYTVDMRVDYLRPATADVYTITAQVVRLGRTLATADAEVRGTDGQSVACGRAVLQHIRQMAGAREPRPG
jgi:uncharacterized protein (TIGR00369 family)